MPDNTDDLIISISTDVATLRRSLKKMEAAIGESTSSSTKKFDRLGQDIDRSLNRSLGRVSSSVSKMGNVAGIAASQLVGAFAAGASLQAASRLADAAKNISNALKVAGLEGAQLTKVYDALFSSAQRNAAPIDSLVNLYSRLAQTQKELGVSQADLIGFTDKVSLALRVGGTSANEASGALLQLSQALGGGVVRAEEFNSVLEGAPTIAQAVAAGLTEAGGSVAKLRQLVVDGKVSSSAFFRAFLEGAKTLEEKVASAETTTSQHFVRLQNVLTDTAGKIDSATGASDRFGTTIDDLANTIQQFGQIVVNASESEVGKFVGWLSQGVDRASEFKKIMGGIPGIIDKMGKLNYDAFNGKPLGSTMRDEAIQGRIDQAFETQKAAPKTGRLPAAPKPAEPIKRVTLGDYPVAGDGSGASGSKGGATIANSDGLTVPVPTPERKPIRLGDEPTQADELARELGQIKDRTAALTAAYAAQAALNPLVEDYGFAVDKAGARQELLNAALAAGRVETPELAKEIDAAAEAYARATSAAEKLNAQQDKIRADAKATAEQISSVFTSTLKASLDGENIGKAFLKSIADALTTSMNDQLDSIFKQIGGAISRALTGQASASPVSSASSVATTFAAPVGAVTRAPLAGISNYARAIQSIESGGNYGALGPITRNGDRAYGAYQMMGNNIGPWSQAALGRTLTPDQFLADRGAQDAIFNHRFGGYVDRYGASGAAQAWFGGPGSVGKGGMSADVLGTTGNAYVAKFNAALDTGSKSAAQALEKLTGASTETTKGLGSLASSLAAAPGASAGGGGWLSVLAGTPFAGSGQLAASGGVGLFDRGGFTGIGGKKTPAGIVHKGEYVFDSDSVSRLGISTLDKLRGYAAGGYVDAPVAPRIRPRAAAAAGGGQANMLTVQIDGASGDAHVRELVRQGVGQALSEQNQNMRRGGFGQLQAQFISQKG